MTETAQSSSTVEHSLGPIRNSDTITACLNLGNRSRSQNDALHIAEVCESNPQRMKLKCGRWGLEGGGCWCLMKTGSSLEGWNVLEMDGGYDECH